MSKRFECEHNLGGIYHICDVQGRDDGMHPDDGRSLVRYGPILGVVEAEHLCDLLNSFDEQLQKARRD